MCSRGKTVFAASWFKAVLALQGGRCEKFEAIIGKDVSQGRTEAGEGGSVWAYPPE